MIRRRSRSELWRNTAYPGAREAVAGVAGAGRRKRAEGEHNVAEGQRGLRRRGGRRGAPDAKTSEGERCAAFRRQAERRRRTGATYRGWRGNVGSEGELTIRLPTSLIRYL